ncbi:Villin-1 [Apostasia shenzhenica]|uniref:Villin-1 n=1 Tax=Apostasia shenzhenica TaxID=1088818 RepID=A0A2I0A8Y8_9ASPA|nr:Villin-1 [Apostasia shenzhenica]
MWSSEVDEAFRGAGAKAGLEIWCIENLRPVSIPKSSHGKFFSGSTYIVLSTALLKNGNCQHDIHYWLGTEANEEDSNIASDKALELDAALGSRAVHYREVQGSETEKFLSYFKPCIIPAEGLFTSQLHATGNESYPVTLLACKGEHAVHVKEVPFSRSSLNHNDVFILDTNSKIFLFSGCNSSIQERAKALEVVQYVNEKQHGGKCEVATIEDGKFVGDSDAGEFWSLFGGHAPIARDSSYNRQNEKRQAAELFWVNKRELQPLDSASLSRAQLSSDRCYLLDCFSDIFVWMGRTTVVSERKASISAVEQFMQTHDRFVSIHTSFLTEGSETSVFKSYFLDWPQSETPNLYMEGKGKVAALFKHQGYDVKEIPEEDSQPIINNNGILRVWRVNSHDISPLLDAEQRMLYGGDCYIVKYAYSDNYKDHNLFYAWLGCNSILEDRVDAICLMRQMIDSTKGHYVMAKIFEGKEPQPFFTIFQSLVIFKGGLSSGYKQWISEWGTLDETYDTNKVALFRVQGSSPCNMQAIQVDPVSGSLNSSYCYILQDGASIYTWLGTLSSPADHDLIDRLLDQISPLKQSMSIREGNEPSIFWDTLGSKGDYPKEKDIKKHLEDPHLFTCSVEEGDFKGKEIFNYTQDDLTTEDVLLLDCQTEIYVWVGQHSNLASTEKALSLGKKFLEADILLEGLSYDTAIYVILEGNEPAFFTRYFEWDDSKCSVLGNSFEKKLTILKRSTPNKETSNRRINSHLRYSSESFPDVRRSTGTEGSNKRRESPVATRISTSGDFNAHLGQTAVARELFATFPGLSNERTSAKDEENEEKNDTGNELQTYPYELLKVSSGTALPGIDITRREAYLSNCEFKETFGMVKAAFYKLPKWRQNKLKQALALF